MSKGRRLDPSNYHPSSTPPDLLMYTPTTGAMGVSGVRASASQGKVWMGGPRNLKMNQILAKYTARLCSMLDSRLRHLYWTKSIPKTT